MKKEAFLLIALSLLIISCTELPVAGDKEPGKQTPAVLPADTDLNEFQFAACNRAAETNQCYKLNALGFVPQKKMLRRVESMLLKMKYLLLFTIVILAAPIVFAPDAVHGEFGATETTHHYSPEILSVYNCPEGRTGQDAISIIKKGIFKFLTDDRKSVDLNSLLDLVTDFSFGRGGDSPCQAGDCYCVGERSNKKMLNILNNIDKGFGDFQLQGEGSNCDDNGTTVPHGSCSDESPQMYYNSSLLIFEPCPDMPHCSCPEGYACNEDTGTCELPVFQIDSCQIIQEAGIYQLTQDISIDSADDMDPSANGCIDIRASPVEVDCMGNTISFQSIPSIGVISDAPDSVIQNCNIQGDFLNGISLLGSPNSNIFNNHISGSPIGATIRVTSSNDVIIEQNTGTLNRWGIIISNSANNHLEDNVISDLTQSNAAGISILDGEGNNVLSGNEVRNNGYGAFFDTPQVNNHLTENTFCDNSEYDLAGDPTSVDTFLRNNIGLCAYDLDCGEDCNDGVDNDCDGMVDMEDYYCSCIPTEGQEDTETDCDDGEDNDCDAWIDGADEDCDSTCFLEGTLITMADGSLRQIEDVKVGDKVTSYDFKNKKKAPSTVSETFEHTADKYLIINDLAVTPEHPLWVNNQWIEAGNVKVGDTIMTQSLEQSSIEKIQTVFKRSKVYNIEVLPHHNFLALGYLGHNLDKLIIAKEVLKLKPKKLTGLFVGQKGFKDDDWSTGMSCESQGGICQLSCGSAQRLPYSCDTSITGSSCCSTSGFTIPTDDPSCTGTCRTSCLFGETQAPGACIAGVCCTTGKIVVKK